MGARGVRHVLRATLPLPPPPCDCCRQTGSKRLGRVLTGRGSRNVGGGGRREGPAPAQAPRGTGPPLRLAAPICRRGTGAQVCESSGRSDAEGQHKAAARPAPAPRSQGSSSAPAPCTVTLSPVGAAMAHRLAALRHAPPPDDPDLEYPMRSSGIIHAGPQARRRACRSGRPPAPLAVQGGQGCEGSCDNLGPW